MQGEMKARARMAGAHACRPTLCGHRIMLSVAVVAETARCTRANYTTHHDTIHMCSRLYSRA